jgi:hypoxanthine phosphoribosyltransferase
VQVVPLFSAAQVHDRVSEIADRLYRDYADSPLTILCIASGARRFVETLSERLLRGNVRHDVQYATARRTSETDSGAVQVDGFDPSVLEERDVLVVDDVANQGTTLRAVLELMALAETRTVRTAVLVDKRERGLDDVRLDFESHVVEEGWVVGYGLEVEGEFGELDEIGVVSQSEF